MTIASALYFDGTTSERHAVTAEVAPDALLIRDQNGADIGKWPYAELRAQPAPDGTMRLRRAGGPELARLEIQDAALIAEIGRRADRLGSAGRAERRLRRQIIVWSVAAVASLVAIAIFGLPLLADRLAPLIPLSVESRLGDAVNAQVRSMLDNGRSGKPFECGTTEAEQPGRLALDLLIGKLETAAELPIPFKAAVIRRRETNAIALPGGHIYVFEGLIGRSRSADELAGALAHEIGHVARRDGTRSLLEAAGLSFLFGVLLGDFTGGGLVVVAARTLVQSAYSREVEAAADRYGVNLMAKAGGDPRALAAILDRIAGSIEPGPEAVANHPQTADRIAAIKAAAAGLPAPSGPMLYLPDWAALKRICG
jgi:Zn-dependent protease with chaperone function